MAAAGAAGVGLAWYDPQASVPAKAPPPPPPHLPSHPRPPTPPTLQELRQPARRWPGAAKPVAGSAAGPATPGDAEHGRREAGPGSAAPSPPARGREGEERREGRGEDEVLDAREPAPSSALDPPSAARQLDALEVARSVDEATKAKEELAMLSIHRARDEVLAQRAALKAQVEEQERRLREEEVQLARLERELRSGVNQDERSKIEALRAQIEVRGREVGVLEREVATRRDMMRRATDAYVEAEERLAQRREQRRRLEEEMLELILSAGRAKDDRLTGVLLQVPEVGSAGRGLGSGRDAGSPAEATGQSVEAPDAPEGPRGAAPSATHRPL
mmetsp:Transcript_8646/g.26924  ORF Transcript_8646/g.26924 Transcript_8646/m.26924 type:complete len:332 (+) Transcript_8646:73-1068(+)